MKKFFSILILPLLLFSCVNKQDMEGTEVITIRFTAGIAETKTELGDKVGTSYPNYWSAQDAISVNGVTSAPIDDNYVGQKRAEFDVTLTEANAYHFA